MLTQRLWFSGPRWVQASSYFQSSSGLRTADALRFSNYLSPCYHQMSACTLRYHMLPLQEGPASSRIAGTPKCKWLTEHDGDGGGRGLPPAESGQCLGITTDSFFQRAQGFCPLDRRLHCDRVPRSVLRYYRGDACHRVTLPHSLAAPEIKCKWAFIAL